MSVDPVALARQAGQAASSEPPERRHVGACPFEVGTPERKAWLEGFAEEHKKAVPTAQLEKQLSDALALEDDHGRR
jgi:hypothetical protein